MHPNAPHHTGSDQIIAEARCWDDFWRTLRQQDSGSKRGPGFERLTQLYLQTSPEYRTQLRHVWLLNEVPESVSAHLNLPRVYQRQNWWRRVFRFPDPSTSDSLGGWLPPATWTHSPRRS